MARVSTSPSSSDTPYDIAIVEQVADAKELDVMELDPLNDVIDVDALAALFQEGAEGKAVFDYQGVEVTVTGDGSVSVRTNEP